MRVSLRTGKRWWGDVRLALLLCLATASLRATTPLEIAAADSFIQVEVHVPLHSFRAHLTRYDARVGLAADGHVASAAVSFRFSDLHSGNGERDGHMLAWLGGHEANARFEVEKLTLDPHGEGSVLGLFEMHGVKRPLTFPITVSRRGRHYEISGDAKLDYRQWELPLLARVGERVDPILSVHFKLVGEAR